MYYDENAFGRLISFVSDPELAEAVIDAVNSCAEYVAGVVDMEIKTTLAAKRYEGNDYQEAVMIYDADRSRKHNAAIANIKMMNRIAEAAGMSPIYTGDPDNRIQIAEFCIELTTDMFMNRRL